MKKPFSPSADRNKEPILDQLRRELPSNQHVLELGSGTGQHACYFANSLPNIIWQPTDLKQNLPGIASWASEHGANNLQMPIELDVNTHPWPIAHTDVCFTCNTFHIVSEASVSAIFKGSQIALNNKGKLCVYGPFSKNAQHTSQSNVQFDLQLREANPISGIRDLSMLDEIAIQHGFNACRYTQMPVNNLFVVWECN